MRHTLPTNTESRRRTASAAAIVLLVIAPLASLACGGSGDGRGGGVTEERTQPTRTTSTTYPSPPKTEQVTDQVTEKTPEEQITLEPVSIVPEIVSYKDAESAFLDRRYEEAVELFVLYTDGRPENPWGHYMLGLSSWKSGDLEGAERAFERALELDPKHEKSLINVARVLLEQDRPEDALEKIESALENDSESNPGHRLMGRVRYALGDVEGALESYRRAITIDDEDAWSMNNLGLIYIREGRFGDALPPLARATELEDGVASFMNNLGIALERMEYFEASAEAYKSVLAVDASYDKAAVSLARVEGREEKRDSVPVDLVALSQNFQAEVQRWRESQIAEVDPVEGDSTTVGTVEISSAEEEKDPEDGGQER